MSGIAASLREDERIDVSTVAPGPNKQLEVLVQGKQAKAVVEYLVKKGIPTNWIQTEDQTKGKK